MGVTVNGYPIVRVRATVNLSGLARGRETWTDVRIARVSGQLRGGWLTFVDPADEVRWRQLEQETVDAVDTEAADA